MQARTDVHRRSRMLAKAPRIPASRRCGTVALAALLVMTSAGAPAMAGGTGTTSANTAPVTPPSVTTSSTQVSAANQGSATCGAQLTDAINQLGQASAGLTTASALAHTIADSVLSAEFLTEIGFANPSPASGALLNVAGDVLDVTNAALAITTSVVTTKASTLNSCDTEFTGTVTVDAGGTNVTGDSIYNNNLGVVANLNVGGNISGSQITATQGISADNGAITLGDPNLTHSSDPAAQIPILSTSSRVTSSGRRS